MATNVIDERPPTPARSAGAPRTIPRATVCFLKRDGRILLQERAAGRLWAGRLNGPGGKVQGGETPDEAIVREVEEETGLRIVDPSAHGDLDLLFGVPKRSRLLVSVYSCANFSGRARGGREGPVRWYAEHRLPFDRLWPDMRFWLPIVLAGGRIEGRCLFDEDGVSLLSCRLRSEWQGSPVATTPARPPSPSRRGRSTST